MVGRLSLATALLALATACGSSNPTPGTPTETTPRNRNSRGGASVTELDLRGMLPPVPEYEGQGRNLFAYGAVRRPTPAPVRATPPPTPRANNTTTAPPVAGSRPPARLNVKYAGFVEKTEKSGNKSKYAIFLDGNEILAGAEGETIANRFTVVEIGLESVTVSAQGSNATERIPLQAN